MPPQQQDMMEQMMQQMMGGGTETPKAQPRNVAADGDEDGPHKQWTSVYPIYLDAKRRYRHGCRRVAYHRALLFPNSQLIANAARKMQLEFMHEVSSATSRGGPAASVDAARKGVEALFACGSSKPATLHPERTYGGSHPTPQSCHAIGPTEHSHESDTRG